MKKTVLIVLAFALLFAACPAAFSESEHYMGPWHYLPEGTHWAKCTRCDYVMTEKCDCFEYEYEAGQVIRVCPVCGQSGEGTGRALRPTSLLYDYTNSPLGDLLVFEYASPLKDCAEVRAAYSVIFEYAGRVMDFDGKIDVSIPFACDEQFSVVKVYDDIMDDVAFEYDEEAGVLTFTVKGGSGLFLVCTNS
ncbi:MAG: hypothetical protein IJM56_06745 [Clostridia bacterium]|nr:hypothetical protein [Clostridia bacterium]